MTDQGRNLLPPADRAPNVGQTCEMQASIVDYRLDALGLSKVKIG
jgi:hypothetical protein